MADPVRLTQLARLLGRPDLLAAEHDVGLPAMVQRAVDGAFDRLVRGLLEEAAASDDVVDAASAAAFIDDRLAFLGDLLSEEQRRRLSEACRKVTEGWG